MKPNMQVNLRDEAVVQARQTIERRVNELGVTEPSIAQQGHERRSDPRAAARRDRRRPREGDHPVDRPPRAEDRRERARSSTREALLVNGAGAAGHGNRAGRERDAGRHAGTVYYLVRKVAAVTGRDLRNARPTVDENNQPAVSFTLSSDGGRKFGKVTGENIGRQLAIILDGRVQSAPRIDSRITTDGRITGSFTQEEVQNLSLILRSGALPASLTYLEERTIGPTLGADSIRSGVIASVVGLLLVIVVHARLLQAVGRERGRGARLQPDHPARPDGLHRRGDDAAGHRRLRADDGHRRRLERADLRAHQGRARGGARRARLDQRRLQPRVPDAGRHAHRGAHLGGVPLPVRHRADPRLRGDAVGRSAVEPVHLDLRVEDAVRAGARRAASRSRRCPSSHAYLQRTRTSTSCAGAGRPSPSRGSSSSPGS